MASSEVEFSLPLPPIRRMLSSKIVAGSFLARQLQLHDHKLAVGRAPVNRSPTSDAVPTFVTSYVP